MALINLNNRCTTVQVPANLIRLSNGLTVIHQHLSATPVVVVDVWIKAGAIAEPDSWLGMAHFLEHMIFKGSKRIRPREFDQIIEGNGGTTNAATSHDYAHFYLTTANRYLPNTLPHLAEILLQAVIPDEEFYREREVVLEELRSCQDDPDWLAFQSLCESLYQCHPYGRSILGNEVQLMQHSPNQMRCFHRTYYQPENITVSIIGGIEEKQALALVEEAFSEFGVRSECPANIIEAEPPLITVRRSQMHLPRLEQGRLLMGWIGPGVDCLEDAFGLDLLSVILASGRSSRLVRELREEKQLVWEIESHFSLQRDSSLFTIGAWLDPQHLDQVEMLICDRLAALSSQPITEAELAKAKRLLSHDYFFSTETAGQLAGLYGYYQTIASVEVSTLYPAAIAQFSTADLQRLASQYLSPERYAVTILQPC